MSKIINNREYKIVYLDTNAVSDISKNHKNAGKNFFEFFINNYPNENFTFAISYYNLLELSRATKDKEKIIKYFDEIPLLICDSIPNLLVKEENKKDFVLFSTEPKPLFDISISDLFIRLKSKDFEESLNKFNMHINQEIDIWNKNRNNKVSDLNKIFSDSYKIYCSNKKEINILSKTQGAMIFSFIKDHFVNKTSKKIDKNSIIDAYDTSIAPCVDFYVSERVIISWLDFSKDKFDFMKNLKTIKISEFYDKEVN